MRDALCVNVGMNLNHADIIALLGVRELASEMNVKERTVRSWRQRNSIPPPYWQGVVMFAFKKGEYVSPELLMISTQDRRAA